MMYPANFRMSGTPIALFPSLYLYLTCLVASHQLDIVAVIHNNYASTDIVHSESQQHKGAAPNTGGCSSGRPRIKIDRLCGRRRSS
ncbi:uncharacterized protein EDB91DRAFT_360769 [Suillus paluster]|uniref:uncharacterized protein n=1 Tax=Suillus paluster TaxID=48578 RepID=UPI001B85CCF5|nr:uncharacterized protein EDB91DRAFT_360769 [Suillus paluster]KAG1740163.1 hypothetical protein EDB91DRAFT_360769 [Suillus paluster]